MIFCNTFNIIIFFGRNNCKGYGNGEGIPSFIAPVEIVAGEDQMQSLAECMYRVINNEEMAKIYDEEVQM